MPGLWSGQPNTVRLDELDVICAVFGCEVGELLLPEPVAVPEPAASQSPGAVAEARAVTPRPRTSTRPRTWPLRKVSTGEGWSRMLARNAVTRSRNPFGGLV